MKSPAALSWRVFPGAGFSIIEILVAAAVLALLVALVAQMVGGASQIAGGGRKRMDADNEARAVFDRMAGDMAQMVKRPDADVLFIGKPGSDEMYFYSQAPANFTNSGVQSPVALVGYRVNSSNQLERYGSGRSWDELKFLTVSGTGVTNENSRIETPTDGFHVISPSVFRMEYAFLMKGGANFSKTNNPGLGMSDVSAVVVTLGVLDETSQKNLPPGGAGTMASELEDSADAGAAGKWVANALSASDIPSAAKSQVRIYQRYFYLSP